MKSLREQIEEGVSRGLHVLLGPEAAGLDPLVRPTQDAKFGDFQSNVALGLAKRLGEKPRDTAERLVGALELGEICEPPEIAGPGFINFRIRTDYLARALESIQDDPRLGIAAAAEPKRVLVDFSSPNLAKEMHIGHLRTTVIGDTLSRLFEFLGHDVLRLNHVGDWGTQFGMLLQFVREEQPEVLEHPERFHVDDLEQFYIAAKTRFDADPHFADAARRAVVDLQAGDPVARKLWGAFCAESLRHAHALYRRLDVRLVDRGESYYNDLLPRVVRELRETGLAGEDRGATVVFLEGYTNREGEPLPLIIQKRDEGYLYATTDLAAIQQRVSVERADRIIYVTDVRQGQHFEMVFAVARQAGWVPEDVRLEHVGYGMILDKNSGKVFKTREGNTVKLRDVLDEAEVRALQAISEDERRAELSEELRREIARVVGIGAVKYADLSHNPSSDYKFDWEQMLALEGNTAPYLLYAYVRTRGIARKAGLSFEELPRDAKLILDHPSEVALAKQLLQVGATVRHVSETLEPHHLTDYLYNLSRAFSTFFDRERGVRVVDAEPLEVRQSRLRLCDLTARTLRLGLSLLGIQVLEQM